MTTKLPFTQAAIRPRPSRDEIEFTRLQLDRHIEKVVAGTATETLPLDLEHYSSADIHELTRPDRPPPSPHAIRFGHIYVGGFSVYVKIGWSTDVRGRACEIEDGLPETFTIYHTRTGSIRDERALHRRFKALRLRGEWFRREGELDDWIRKGCPA